MKSTKELAERKELRDYYLAYEKELDQEKKAKMERKRLTQVE